MSHPLAIPEFLLTHAALLLGSAAIIIGLCFGFSDLLRFSLVRSYAISSVCFAESIRRRILLITPVAILGIIVVAQLQHPIDAQDAIRQTIKVALFATGLVVVISTIIMACTNLPKEIDNRVIYTIVTKPTTRLEIVLGKILGFAKVSALLLLIMGLFTWSYVSFRAWNYQREIHTMLADNKVDDATRSTYQHYASAGLLSAKKYATPEEFQVLAKVPSSADDNTRWVFGSAEQDVLIPFSVKPSDFIAPGSDSINVQQGAVLVINLDYTQRPLTPEELKRAPDEGVDLSGIATTSQGPLAPNAKPDPFPPPRITVQFLDHNRNSLPTSSAINGGKPIIFPPKGQPIEARVAGDALGTLARAGRFYVQIVGVSPGTQYGFKLSDKPEDAPVTILIPGNAPGQNTLLEPALHLDNLPPLFRGRLGTDGQQLRGGPAGQVPAAIYTFHNASLNPRQPDNTIPFEFTTAIEKSGDEPSDVDVPTNIDISFIDLHTGKTTPSINLTPESNRTSYFNVPASWLTSGDFNVVVRDLTPTHWAGVRSEAFLMVIQDQPFALNLLKSLFIMWLLALLVIVISVFCSTFLSWPIAIVLTLVILLGKWGVDELGDATGSGIGNQVATDLGFRDPADAKVVSTSVEALSRFLNTVSTVLPDINAFGGTDSVEKGVTIPASDVYLALVVLLSFGIPLTSLAYIFLKNKEVAP
ncbi:MAG TPA: hypothetical protein VFE58_00225 [Tepidisphaeraceae bacterium]|jgi:hypothetical protein|nr:hypothetical protein [Tepidisphaeraceae bacterium]